MYFQKLYSHSRKLFFAVLAFCLLQVFFTYKGIETFPFFNYGMYSEKLLPNRAARGIKIIADGEPFDCSSLPSLNKEMLLCPLSCYSSLKQDNFNDSKIKKAIAARCSKYFSENSFLRLSDRLTNSAQDTAAFQSWFKKYLETSSGRNYKNIEVYSLNFKYENNILVHTDLNLLFKQ